MTEHAMEGRPAAERFRDTIASALTGIAHTRSEAGLPLQSTGERRSLARKLLVGEIASHNQERLIAGRPTLSEVERETVELR